jgi:hypothetical protein
MGRQKGRGRILVWYLYSGHKSVGEFSRTSNSDGFERSKIGAY